MEYLILSILIILNGVFAMAEVALLSSRKVRLEKLAHHGNKRAALALKFANDPQKFLPTVQIGMTAVSIIAGVYSGSTIGEDLSRWFEQFTWLADYASLIGYFIVVSITTFFTLVVGELVPKTIGLNKPEQIAILTAPVMKLVSWIASPLIWLLNMATSLILKLLSIKKKSEPPVTEEELKHLIEQSSEHGVLEKQETEMMKGVMRIADRRVDSFMTHRSDVIWIEAEEEQGEIMKKISDSSHTNFPVCEESLDSVVGVVSIKDIFLQMLETRHIDVKKIMKQPLFVPETMPAIELLETFRKSRIHSGLVLNEYGFLEGIVTLHDIMEALVGDLPATTDEQQAVKRKDDSWLIDGMMNVDEWSELLQLKHAIEEDEGVYKTLGGFVMDKLGRIPKEADSFSFGGYSFEVMDMDGMRVDKVLAKKEI